METIYKLLNEVRTDLCRRNAAFQASASAEWYNGYTMLSADAHNSRHIFRRLGKDHNIGSMRPRINFDRQSDNASQSSSLVPLTHDDFRRVRAANELHLSFSSFPMAGSFRVCRPPIGYSQMRIYYFETVILAHTLWMNVVRVRENR